MRRVSTAAPAGTIHANFRTARTAALAFALTALALATAFLALAPTASAAKETFATLGSSAAAAGGQFNAPRGIAVNQSGNGAPAGTFYVVDASNNRIQQFDPSGEFVRAWGWGARSGETSFEICTVADKCQKGIAGNEAGQLSNAQGIAVDQNTGNVFVSNNGSRRISVFKPNGVFLGAFGWGALDGSASLQFCTTATGCGAPGSSPPGSGNVGAGQFGILGGLATDAEGNLYVANRTSRRVDVFKPLLTGSAVTGVEFLRSFGWGAATGAAEFQVCTASPCKAPAATGSNPGQFGANSPADVGVDGEGNIYALDTGNKRVQKFSSAPAPLVAALGAPALSAAFGSGNLIALAVEPETNDILVLGNRAAGLNRVAIVQMTSEGAAVDTHGTAFKGNTAVGLAVAQPSNGGTVYFSSSAESLHRVFALNDPALVPSIEPVSGVSAPEATFSGQVVSEEVESAYRFEYSTDGAEWINAPASDASVGPQPGSVSVQESVAGLVPNTKYGVRLTAMRPAGSWKKTSGIVSFTTPAVGPSVEGGMATQVSNSGARLVAYLNPNNSPTSYRFEYGTTEAYGSSTAIASAGSGAQQKTVSQLIAGLAPSTTYHFRVVATNQAGTEVGPDLTFTTGSVTPVPPEGRAYELVSPAVNNGQRVSVGSGNLEPTAADDGEAVAYQVWGPVPGAEAGGFVGNVVAYRSPDGWITDPVNPFQNPAPIGGASLQLLSDDLSRIGITGPASPQAAPGVGEGSSNLFLHEPATDVWKGVSLNTPENVMSQMVEGVGGSADLSTILFSYDGDPPLVPDGANERQLYMWTEATESIDLVGREPGTNEAFQTPTYIPSYYPDANPISEDGSRIFFITHTESRQLWVRIIGPAGSTTKHVSASQWAGSEPWEEADAMFGYAPPDGSAVFFTSPQKLTDDSSPSTEGGEDLYRYDVESGDLTDLTVVPSSENGAEVLGVLGGSTDGSIVYFASRRALAPGAEDGSDNLFVWRDDGSAKGVIEFVVKDVQERNYLPSESRLNNPKPARVTPDGSKVLFSSTQSLTDYPTNGTLQAYLYDAVTDQVHCVSCNPMGGPATADVIATGAGDLPRQAQTLTDDGKRVFFTSAEALVPEDEDTGLDAYEYFVPGEQITLLSYGSSDAPSLFQDASDNGRDVFITTRDALVGIDQNETDDLYDVRIGGGFADQNPPPPPIPCGPGECQAPVPAAPPAVPGSATVQGPGNQLQQGKRAQKPKKKCKKQGKKKRGKRCAGKAGKRHGRR